MNSWTKVIFKSALFVVSLAGSLALVEIGTRYLIVPERLGVPATQAFRVNGNDFNARIFANSTDETCTWLEFYRPSFRFGYVYNGDGRCHRSGVDRNGFLNANPFPEALNSKTFSILVLGASVAEQLALNAPGFPSLLEQEFSRRFKGPNDQEITIYSGAIGGWAVPNQELVALTYLRGFDAIILVDGANELDRLGNEHGLEDNDHKGFAFWFDHSPLFQLEFATLKFVRNMQLIAPLSSSYAVAGLRALLEDASAKSLGVYDAQNIVSVGSLAPAAGGGKLEANFEFNIERYIQSARDIHAMARANGLKSLHLIQPIAAIGKVLTDEEKPFGEYNNKSQYRVLEKRTLDALKNEPTFSLLDLFAQTQTRIYSDPVHSLWVGNENPGYKIMTEKIATLAAQQWKLRPAPLASAPRPAK